MLDFAPALHLGLFRGFPRSIPGNTPSGFPSWTLMEQGEGGDCPRPPPQQVSFLLRRPPPQGCPGSPGWAPGISVAGANFGNPFRVPDFGGFPVLLGVGGALALGWVGGWRPPPEVSKLNCPQLGVPAKPRTLNARKEMVTLRFWFCFTEPAQVLAAQTYCNCVSTRNRGTLWQHKTGWWAGGPPGGGGREWVVSKQAGGFGCVP